MRTAKTLIRLADMSLRWAHMPFCWFCHEAAHITMMDSLRQLFYPRMRQAGRETKFSDNHKKEYSCPMCDSGLNHRSRFSSAVSVVSQ